MNAYDNQWDLVIQEKLVADIIAYYERFADQSPEVLSQLYADDITFIDPIHKVNGIESLINYFGAMSAGLKTCEFEFTDKTHVNGEVWLKWLMHYSHDRIKNGMPQTLAGVSHIKMNNKIIFHQDFYDLGAMLYEHVPVLGAGVRWLKQRLIK